ncbi:NAD(P)-binding protein [Bacteriovorax sp. PP10]|uniref:NAD(P)-binding protein n=1 Tax=Bacteriovorax antarcticus TaxID=3088717 RepID=A0ABU5VYD2_9BACT|nr:NAD(P)-binding protein [Bacteriovorax sp. PP10]MEA9358076.1 NAD(P)-binding protein [Bacteriovorax sp. PP10]
MQYSSKDKIEKSYDVIVIGSGLAGMTLANKMARDGRSVLLLESHNKLGGFATWFKRKDGEHIFDVSLHGFPVGMIKTCRKYWTKDIADRIHQLKSVRYINPQFEVETDFTKTDFIKVLIEKFSVKEETVNAFFEDLATMNFYDNSKMTNGELFEKYFPGRSDITRFLLEPIVYANGSNLEDPAISYGIVFSNFMSKGVYIFQGGTDMMIGLMKEEMLKNGVDIQLQAMVSKILIEDKKAIGVEIKGHKVYSKAVVSNSNLKSTVFKMAGAENFSPEFVKKADEVRLNTSSCQVYMGLKKGESIPFIGDLIFTSEDKDFSTDLILSPKVGSQTFSLYYPEMRPHLAPSYAVVSSSNSKYEDWKSLSEEDYEKQKQYLIERALRGLEKIVPGIREKIDYVDAATPLTVERYTNHVRGASFGTKFEGLDVSMNMHKELPGLFHAGSVGIIMSGWLGAANYGVIQAHEVDNYLSKLEKLVTV